MPDGRPQPVPMQPAIESTTALLRELVAHLRQNRTQLREEWARRITEAQLPPRAGGDKRGFATQSRPS